VRALLDDAGVELRAGAFVEIPEEVPEEVRVEPGTLHPGGLPASALPALGPAGGLFVPVALVRRLRWRAPEGTGSVQLAAFSTRTPGGFSPGPTSAILLATEDEEGPLGAGRGQWLGMILAHELGHYLGLRHDEELHTTPAGASTLMTARIAQLEPGQVAFSEAQQQALRAHPLVTFSEASP
jgi:hypothetical protein